MTENVVNSIDRRAGLAAMLTLTMLAAGCSMTIMGPSTPDYAAIVGAPDRGDADKKNDERRQPVKILEFTGVRPGWKVLDMGAGAGYSTELLARAVAPGGVVYAQNGKGMMSRVKPVLEARLRTPGAKNIVNDIRPYDDPLPPGVDGLDLVTFFYFYHDTTYMPVDRAKMDQALFDALKPGGVFVVADYSAKPGADIGVGKTLHRIDQATERAEIEAAGFRFVAEGDFLRNPNDPRTEPIFHPKQPVDIFVMKFRKPG
jgi:predicted methyltransferase